MTDDNVIARGYVTNGFDAAMQFRFVSATKDEIVVEFDIDAQHRQPYGIVHGGVYCAVFESVCSTGAALNAMPRGQSVVGLENHTTFVRAARSGHVRVTARPVTRGRRTQVWEAEARGDDEKLLATGRVRLLCLEREAEIAGETVKTPGA
ncbi:MAG: PaaI family thioesterase [Candidatus Binatia bacterium]